MKIALITDIHFGVRDNSDVFLKEYERFFTEEFFPALEQHKVSHIINLGDTWDNPVSISPKAYDVFYRSFLTKLPCTMDVVLGNHDVYYRNRNDVNSIRMTMGNCRNINIHDVKFHDDPETGIAYCPWINKANKEEMLQAIHDSKSEYLMGHFDIAGFEMIKGHVSTSGLDQSLFKKFKGVYSGHFHVRGKRGNITYLSNHVQTNWSDVGLEKGFHILDTETGELLPFNNTHQMFKTCKWAGKETPAPDSFGGSYVRLFVGDSGKDDRTAINRWVNTAEETAVKVYVIENESTIESTNDESTLQGTKEIIHEYIDGMIENIDKDKMKGKFFDLYDRTTANMDVE